MIYELEIGGKVVRKMHSYEGIMEWASLNTDLPFQVFIRRKSKMALLAKRITSNEMEEVLQLRRKKWQWNKIAKYMGWSIKALQVKMKKDYGSEIMVMNRMNPQKRQNAISQYARGNSIKDIAKDLGVCHTTIWRIVTNKPFKPKVTG